MNNPNRRLLLTAGAALGTGSALRFFSNEVDEASAAPFGVDSGLAGSAGASSFGQWGVDLAGRDLSIRPGDNFYRYANGLWNDKTTIPMDRARFGNLDLMVELTQNRLRDIIESAASRDLTDRDAAKIGGAYRAFMNEALVEALDAKPLSGDLATVRTARSHEALARLMARATQGFQPSLFPISIDTDAKQPRRYAVYLDTGGLGLPDCQPASKFDPRSAFNIDPSGAGVCSRPAA